MRSNNISSARAWLRALELTAPIAAKRDRTLPVVLAAVAERMGDAPALLSDGECLSYRELSWRINQYARWALLQPLRRGDVVCLMSANRPEYLAIWLGLTRAGIVVALLNTNLLGASLAHAVSIARPQHIIADSTYLRALDKSLPQTTVLPGISILGPYPAAPRRLQIKPLNIQDIAGDPLSREECRPPEIGDLALYLYTSGTTGLPKAAKVTHARLMQWSHWSAGIMDITANDRMYNCLPMYHSVGGIQAPGALLVSGGSVVLRERFSARAFWDDVVRWECTVFQYIGELCRYLLQEPSGLWQGHTLRLAFGNGLAPEIWETFQSRFRIPQIIEFYASTEGNVSLFNVEGKVGAIGRIPSYLQHRFSPSLLRRDPVTGEPARNREGFCIRCDCDEAGEALGKITGDPAAIGSHFDGYASEADSRQKILRNVFEPGDAWFRTGDLLRRDQQGFFYFVDRLGDTFRRKGENVSTAEVAAAVCGFPGVQHAVVYGVSVPHVEGRVGMVALVTTDDFDLGGLREHLAHTLPAYARPMFLRLRKRAEVTSTWKYSKVDLTREGFDPQTIADPLYFDLPGGAMFAPLDASIHGQIRSGMLRI